MSFEYKLPSIRRMELRVRCGVLADACRVDETNAGLERELGESLGAG